MPRALLIDAEPALREALAREPMIAGVELEAAASEADALRRVRRRSYDVVVTSARTPLEHDLVLVGEIRCLRPGVKAILLGPSATPEEVIAALRGHVFACFTVPFEILELAEMIRRAVDAEDWRDGIEVVSAQPDWLAVRVSCRLLTAERLLRFLSELQGETAEVDKVELLAGLREVLINAMEHGAGFDPDLVVEVAAVRTRRTIVYYVRDPGPGFSREDLSHAAVSNPPDDPMAHMDRRDELGLRPGGFGLLVARQVVDEMIHSEHGNEVLLIKHTR
jgi:anti-sigma regulatory factor (Ser/Thr protein kinase)/CheY-like chemotaxis protein